MGHARADRIETTNSDSEDLAPGDRGDLPPEVALRRADPPALLARYAGAAAHDLKSVIRHIGIFATDLRDESPDATERRELVNAIIQRADALDDMVGALRNFTTSFVDRPALRQASLRDAVFEAASEVERRLFIDAEELPRLAAMPAIRVDGDAQVSADHAMLVRAFAAIIENSALHCGAKPIDLTVAIEVGERCCVLHFRDTGPGVREQYAERLFQPFERGSRKGAAPRLGLGLAMCRQLIAAHGGTVAFAPSANGAVVRIELPTGD